MVTFIERLCACCGVTTHFGRRSRFCEDCDYYDCYLSNEDEGCNKPD